MKNIIITPRQIKRELIIWLLCLIIAIGLNVYAIIIYSTSWSELYSQAGYVVVLSFFLYVILWIFRGLFRLIRFPGRKKENS
ncbi:hypothetical protein [Thermophagus xiamenensis]|uniref:Uncharacterized protein n=1 Tax=Thermophagus xiamenensis TaxID=385682 RepID=A0A1I1XGV8_9BACT|nr:hypothetical protein [Thermophagus xiamenensis]SFE05898.1 hypothetical protein SAMN05444380_10613 [Thermophagus xiamenensis]